MNSNIIKSDIFLEKLFYESINDFIIERLNENSNQNCIIDCALDRKWTKRQVLDSSLKFANYLINDCNLSKGDVVCFVANASDIHVIGFFGVLLAGGVFCSLDSPLTEFEIQTKFQQIKPNVVGCDGTQYDMVMMNAPDIKNILLIEHDQTHSSRLSIEQIITRSPVPDLVLPKRTEPGDIAVLAMTSGYTNESKPLIRTNANILWTAFSVKSSSMAAPDDKVLFNSFAGNLIIRVLMAVNKGAQVAVVRSKDHDYNYQSIHNYGITIAVLTNPRLDFLVNSYPKYDENYLSCLEKVYMGGAFPTEGIYQFILSKYNMKSFLNVYGLAETGGIAWTPFEASLNSSTVGKAYPNTELMIVDELGHSLPANRSGEICVRSPMVSPGYLNNTCAENALLFTGNGFFKTGDIGYYDENRVFYICARNKELIKVESYLVVPAELENILLTHSDVSNAAVIGIADEERGEVPLAFVTLVKGANVTVDELLEYVNSRVNNYKQLKGGMKILDAFPMTQTEKINKIKLKELFLK